MALKTLCSLGSALTFALLSFGCGGHGNSSSSHAAVSYITMPASFAGQDAAYDSRRHVVYVCGVTTTGTGATAVWTGSVFSFSPGAVSATPVPIATPVSAASATPGSAIAGGTYTAIAVSDDGHYAIVGCQGGISFIPLDSSPALAAINLPTGMGVSQIWTIPKSKTEFLVSMIPSGSNIGTNVLTSTLVFSYTTQSPLGAAQPLGATISTNASGSTACSLGQSTYFTSAINANGTLGLFGFSQFSLASVGQTSPVPDFIYPSATREVTDSGLVLDPLSGSISAQVSFPAAPLGSGGLVSRVGAGTSSDSVAWIVWTSSPSASTLQNPSLLSYAVNPLTSEKVVSLSNIGIAGNIVAKALSTGPTSVAFLSATSPNYGSYLAPCQVTFVTNFNK